MTETVELQCRACGKIWTEPKDAFVARFKTGQLGHTCAAVAA